MHTESTHMAATARPGSTGSAAQNTLAMKSINTSAPVQCSKSITIQASRETVWAVLTDIDNWATWQTDISNPKLKGELAPDTMFDWKTGGVNIHSTLHTVDPCRQLGWTGKTWGMFAIHNWTLTEKEGSTTVAVDESMEGLLAKWLKNSFNKSLEKGMQTWLDRLKDKCESKEPSRSTHPDGNRILL